MTHSPGPWTVSTKGSYTGVMAPPRKDFPHGQVVAQVCRGPGKNTVDNAHVLAAGPELLAALKAAITDLESVYEGDDDAADAYGVTATLKAARAAIAKARGA